MPDHSYNIERQPNGLFRARIFGGYIEEVKDCPTWNNAVNSALYAIAKNKEYIEEAAVSSHE